MGIVGIIHGPFQLNQALNLPDRLLSIQATAAQLQH